MKKAALLLTVLCFFIPSIALAGNIFIEEGDLFIAPSYDAFFAHTGLEPSEDLAALGIGKSISAKVANPKQTGKLFREHILMGDTITITRKKNQVLMLTSDKSKAKVKIACEMLKK